MGARRGLFPVTVGLGALFAVAFLSAGAIPPAPAGFQIRGDPERGQQIFQQHCQLCHGARGFGDGPLATRLPVEPRNFHRAEIMQQRTDWRLFQTVKQGGGAVGLSPVMPSFDETLTDQQIHDVLAYIQRFWQEEPQRAR